MKKLLILGFCTLIALAVGAGNFALPTAKAGDTGDSQDYPRCKGPKKKIAVYTFKDGVNNNKSKGIIQGLQESLEYELSQCGCFVVLVTGTDMDVAASEIAHGQSGMSSGNKAPEAGKQLSAQFLIQGTLLEVAQPDNKAAVGPKAQTKVVVLLKLFDPETRAIMASEKGEGIIEKGGVVETVKAGNTGKKTPVSEAAALAVHNGVKSIVKKTNTEGWRATVLKVEGSKVIIRAGTEDGLVVGQILNVFKPGGAIEDPTTGEMLSEPPVQVGQVKVSQVTKTMTYCDLITGPAAAGMFVKMEKKNKKDMGDDDD